LRGDEHRGYRRSGQSQSRCRAFLTPTVVHFGGVLINSLIWLSPWPSALAPSILLGLSAAGALAYLARAGTTFSQIEFVQLDWTDWIIYIGIPSFANVCLIAGAGGLLLRPSYAPYALAASILLQLGIATRNSWAVALWIAEKRRPS